MDNGQNKYHGRRGFCCWVGLREGVPHFPKGRLLFFGKGHLHRTRSPGVNRGRIFHASVFHGSLLAVEVVMVTAGRDRYRQYCRGSRMTRQLALGREYN